MGDEYWEPARRRERRCASAAADRGRRREALHQTERLEDVVDHTSPRSDPCHAHGELAGSVAPPVLALMVEEQRSDASGRVVTASRRTPAACNLLRAGTAPGTSSRRS